MIHYPVILPDWLHVLVLVGFVVLACWLSYKAVE